MARGAAGGPVVTLAPAARDEMLRHARDEAPNECCGLLIGRPGAIERVQRARNLSASPTRYEIDPRDHFAAVRTARSLGRQVIGAYHSHPATAPVPSPSDISEASGDAEFLYVIVSPNERDVRAYYLREGESARVVLETGGAE